MYNFIVIYIQQNATLHSLFYLETALRVSSGTTAQHQESKKTALLPIGSGYFRAKLFPYEYPIISLT